MSTPARMRRRAGPLAAAATALSIAVAGPSAPALAQAVVDARDATDVMAAAPAWLRDYLDLLSKDAANFEAEMHGLGVDHVLTLSGLYPDTDFAEIDRRLARGLGIVRKYRDLWASRGDDARARIRAGAGTPAEKAAMLASFDGSLALARPIFERQWALQEEGVEAYRRIIAVLARRNWVLGDGDFLFRDPRDLEAYRAENRRIDEIGDEVDRLIKLRDGDRLRAIEEVREAMARQ